MQKISFYLILLFNFLSCNTDKKLNDHQLSLKISYLPGFVSTVKPLKCGEINNTYVLSRKDTMILDTLIIKQIIDELHYLKIKQSPKTDCDIRIQCELIIPEKDTINLCIGKSNCIIKNGAQMSQGDKVIYLLRNYSGYYNSFSNEELQIFEELRSNKISSLH
ncbi:hypothetical protein QM480_21125 [Flectobacillus sp. DC10W]|uniref:Lipoprotein n=1 Tax=Flectobacillus longus TaxID=2984207 RepID=A0ABT6YTC3_9BACT|nr:hypothetical protein [Flectobacillus longus]MDI9866854.1 hypothetical protein [Flectobacillus longus]